MSDTIKALTEAVRGRISTTGVGGLTLGGGIGYLTRGVSLSIDNLLAVDVVLADGRQVTASDYQNAAAIHPHSGGDGGYVNFMSSDDDHRAPANYGANYQRLAAVKATYDPDNLFHLNQNIAPANGH
ncbi:MULTISPECIES: BBE domain-containing protein [Cupriavidus]|uniref:BBE domain-containing protein n=1 Tax=Cupriavidus sp. DF5525 TaxID=3160989 RepID=UPI0003B0428F|nr:hypothetical protein N234_36230 [Ralstonia pickettii DTP0602]